MADDLRTVLELLHESDTRWRTLRAEGEEWVDGEVSRRAFLRSVPPGAVVSTRGTPGPADHDARWKVWLRKPAFLRADYGMAHENRMLVVSDGRRVCTWLPMDRGSQVREVQGEPPHLGPAAPLLEPFALPAALHLEVVGPATVLGREAISVVGRPRREGDDRFRQIASGADEIELAVDAERGVLLRLERRLEGVPFARLHMTGVAFDEELDDDLFAVPELSSAPPPVPAVPPRPPRPRPPLGLPDRELGAAADVGTVVVARGPSYVIAVDRVVAYSSGFELGLTVRTNERPVLGSFDESRRREWQGSAAFPGQSLKVDVVFADGRRSPDGGVSLVPVNGVGTQVRFDQRYWVAPLPPPGPLAVVVEWESRGLVETRADLDGGAILEAASRAQALWP